MVITQLGFMSESQVSGFHCNDSKVVKSNIQELSNDGSYLLFLERLGD